MNNPKFSWDEMRTAYIGDGYEERIVEIEGLILSRFRVDAALDFKAEFNALPGGWCQCPHHGFVISGKARVVSAHGDPDVTVETGDVYYQTPGHRVEFLEATELLELSPAGPWREVVDQLSQSDSK